MAQAGSAEGEGRRRPSDQITGPIADRRLAAVPRERSTPAGGPQPRSARPGGAFSFLRRNNPASLWASARGEKHARRLTPRGLRGLVGAAASAAVIRWHRPAATASPRLHAIRRRGSWRHDAGERGRRAREGGAGLRRRRRDAPATGPSQRDHRRRLGTDDRMCRTSPELTSDPSTPERASARSPVR
jgi:hypothetical protein